MEDGVTEGVLNLYIFIIKRVIMLNLIYLFLFQSPSFIAKHDNIWDRISLIYILNFFLPLNYNNLLGVLELSIQSENI